MKKTPKTLVRYDLMNVQRAAKQLGWSRTKVIASVARGEIAGETVAGRLLIRVADVEAVQTARSHAA